MLEEPAEVREKEVTELSRTACHSVKNLNHSCIKPEMLKIACSLLDLFRVRL